MALRFVTAIFVSVLLGCSPSEITSLRNLGVKDRAELQTKLAPAVPRTLKNGKSGYDYILGSPTATTIHQRGTRSLWLAMCQSGDPYVSLLGYRCRVANNEAAQDPSGTTELIPANLMLDEHEGLNVQLEKVTRDVSQDLENRRAYAIRSMYFAQLERNDDRFRELTTAPLLSTNPICEPMLCEEYYARGLTFQAMERDQVAVADFNTVLKMEYTHVGALLARVYSYLRMSELDLAINDANQAVKLTPDNPDAYELRSRTIKCPSFMILTQVLFLNWCPFCQIIQLKSNAMQYSMA